MNKKKFKQNVLCFSIFKVAAFSSITASVLIYNVESKRNNEKVCPNFRLALYKLQ